MPLLLVALAFFATSTLAAPAPTSGTLIGNVFCSSDEGAPAVYVLVAAEGSHLSTHTDTLGMFKLTGVPALQIFTIEAIADPDWSTVSSRFNVVVQPGETLDIGSLDLAVCPPPILIAPLPPEEQAHDL
jgi:hypothetical protein